jgi:hypothetical protein
MDWINEGTYIIVTPVGQNDWQAVVYSNSYRRIADYWCTNPDELDNESWLLIKYTNGQNVILRANPSSPVIGCSHLKAIYVEV